MLLSGVRAVPGVSAVSGVAGVTGVPARVSGLVVAVHGRKGIDSRAASTPGGSAFRPGPATGSGPGSGSHSGPGSETVPIGIGPVRPGGSSEGSVTVGRIGVDSYYRRVA
ncbi:hypothetical protein GCM10010405_60660 [Streptomyces macrosporus]|uniref:Uncharacterized protein n=1 Tax=Streptomyces macrosporus TaxID=44032 RepID=A0ABP5XZ00_9ACTN